LLALGVRQRTPDFTASRVGNGASDLIVAALVRPASTAGGNRADRCPRVAVEVDGVFEIA